MDLDFVGICNFGKLCKKYDTPYLYYLYGSHPPQSDKILTAQFNLNFQIKKEYSVV